MAAEDWIDWGYDDDDCDDPRMGSLVAPTIHETKKAWLIRVGRDEVWLPKSQCRREAGGMGGDTYSIPEWLVIEKGLDGYVEW